MEGPCADSVEKREPASDLAIVVVDSLKRLTPTGRLEKRTLPLGWADHQKPRHHGQFPFLISPRHRVNLF